MGVGKTTVSKKLQSKLECCVYLDGDWCWYTNPWLLTDNTRQMAIENISYLLNNFISCPDYEYIIFSWILHDNSIVDDILGRIQNKDYEFIHLSLTASPDTIVNRLSADLEKSIRTEAIVIERSLERLAHYSSVDSIKIDTTNLTTDDVVNQIKKMII